MLHPAPKCPKENFYGFLSSMLVLFIYNIMLIDNIYFFIVFMYVYIALLFLTYFYPIITGGSKYSSWVLNTITEVDDGNFMYRRNWIWIYIFDWGTRFRFISLLSCIHSTLWYFDIRWYSFYLYVFFLFVIFILFRRLVTIRINWITAKRKWRSRKIEWRKAKRDFKDERKRRWEYNINVTWEYKSGVLTKEEVADRWTERAYGIQEVADHYTDLLDIEFINQIDNELIRKFKFVRRCFLVYFTLFLLFVVCFFLWCYNLCDTGTFFYVTIFFFCSGHLFPWRPWYNFEGIDRRPKKYSVTYYRRPFKFSYDYKLYSSLGYLSPLIVCLLLCLLFFGASICLFFSFKIF
jgi:hypothetical protein